MAETERDHILRRRDRWIAAARHQWSGSSVLVAMSGGVDSSAAAYLLAQAGLTVIGVHFRLVPEGTPATAKGCCHTGSSIDVARVCDHIGATSQVWNFSDLFQTKVIDYFDQSYFSGETPNPCIECNRELKWGALWDRKLLLGIDFISTGHYVRRVKVDNRYWFARGFDPTKDQAYALWVVEEPRRAATLLPLGAFRKSEIRLIAKEAGLPTASNPESQDICFLSGTDYRTWLASKYPDQKLEAELVTSDGKKLGIRENLYHYTVGQRKGLGGGFTEPNYVIDVNVPETKVVVGPVTALFRHRIIVRDIVGAPNSGSYLVQVRYHDPGVLADWTPLPDGRAQCDFHTPVRAPARGQSCVAFRGDRVIAGGIIDEILL